MTQTDHDLITDLMRRGDMPALAQAAALLESFPKGRDALTGDRWIATAIGIATPAVLSWMIVEGAPLDDDNDGYPPIHACLERDDQRLEVLRLLIAAGCDVNARGINNWTPLHKAACQDDLEALQILLDAGANPRLTTVIDDDLTPEAEARNLGHVAAADFIAAYRG